MYTRFAWYGSRAKGTLINALIGPRHRGTENVDGFTEWTHDKARQNQNKREEEKEGEGGRWVAAGERKKEKGKEGEEERARDSLRRPGAWLLASSGRQTYITK